MSVNNDNTIFILDEMTEKEQLYWMLSALREDDIDGFLLDKYTYWTMNGKAQQDLKHFQNPLQKELCNFFLEQTLATSVPHSGLFIFCITKGNVKINSKVEIAGQTLTSMARFKVFHFRILTLP